MQKTKWFTDPIPVKPVIHKFITHGNIIKPYIWNTVYSLLSKNSHPEPSEYKSNIRLPLPEHVFQNQGWSMSPKNVALFNNLIDGYIKDRFECELEANIRRSIKEERKFQVAEMITDLCVHMGFTEEDLQYYTVKKSLQRYCKRYNIDLKDIKIFNKNVPSKPPLVANNTQCMSRAEFCSTFGISERTYSRIKKTKLHVERVGRLEYVDLSRSQIPVTHTVRTFSQH